MEYSWFIDLISTVGFPIAVCIALGWFIFKIYKKSEEREDALREQIVNSQQVNAKAIETLTIYTERLGNIETDVKEIKQIITTQ